MVSNFKSFVDLDLALGPFSVFIGANAAGKSNLVDVFKFLQESLREGLDSPIHRRYGWKGISSRKAYADEVSFELAGTLGFRGPRRETPSPQKESPFSYGFAFGKVEDGFQVKREKLDAVARNRRRPNKSTDPEAPVRLFVRDKDGATILGPALEGTGFRSPFKVPGLEPDHLLLGYRLFVSQISELARYIESWRFYTIDPERARGALRVRETQELSETGDDLSLLLYTLQKDQTKQGEVARNRIRLLMSSLVPGFEGWEVAVEGGQATFMIKERKTKLPFQPGLVSDGTVRLLAFLTSLTYHKRVPTLVCIEEPERSLHPWVMEGLVDFLRQVSNEIQVIVTTHSPYVVRYCRPEEVFIVDKDSGRTRVRRASAMRKITEYVQDFTLDELWLQNYLKGGVP